MAKHHNTQEAAHGDLVTVTLIMPHVHDGQPLRKGDSLQVSQSRASWMRRRGLVEPTEPEPTEPEPTEPEPTQTGE